MNYTCLRCNYKWGSRLLDNKPRACPRCKRYDWNKEIPKLNLGGKDEEESIESLNWGGL